MTDVRRPLHLAVMFGASTAVYAASLAAVTAFQSNDDRVLMQRQAPAEKPASRASLVPVECRNLAQLGAFVRSLV